jgi:hypothetical protein
MYRPLADALWRSKNGEAGDRHQNLSAAEQGEDGAPHGNASLDAEGPDLNASGGGAEGTTDKGIHGLPLARFPQT